MARLTIQIASDVVCPWCYIGERKLDEALRRRPNVRFDIHWRPYLLHPWIPDGGVDRQELLERKLNMESGFRPIRERVEDEGRAVGIGFDFDQPGRVPNTLDAHCLIRWAGEAHVQHEVAERLFEAYFVGGEDIGDHRVLADIAGQAGMSRTHILERLARGDDRDVVRDEAEEIRSMGVTGVPFYLIGRFPVMGAQEPGTLVHVIDRALERQATG